MRNDTLDIAKGVGILLMIIGHMTGMIPFHKWIYQFHMPLFLLISGYFYNDSKYSSFKTLLKVRTKQLLVPYISFFTIIVGTQLLIDPTFKLRSLANGLNHAIWFLLCLYIVELLYWGLLKITNNSFRSVGCCLFIFMVLGFILHHNAIVFPYSICSVPVCMVFYGIGHLCGKNSMICDFMNSPGKPYINLGSSILLLGSLYLYVALTGMHTELAGNLISIYGYLTAIIGSLGIIFVCKLLIFNKMISGGVSWIGKNTLAFIGLNMLLISLCDVYIRPLGIPFMIYKAFQLIIVVAVCSLFSAIAKRYVPFILGK